MASRGRGGRRPEIPGNLARLGLWGALLPALTLAALAGALSAQITLKPKGWKEARKDAMGTTFSVIFRSRSADDQVAVEAALEEVERLDATLSTYREESFVSHLNARAHKQAVRLDGEIRTLLELCLEVHRETGGAFDITVGPLVRAWGFARREGRLPDEDTLARAREAVGSRHLELDAKAGTLRFARKGVELDFGAVGKGWAVDRVVDRLREQGIRDAAVHAGTSTVFALGGTPFSPEGWLVAIEHPREGERPLATVVLKDRSLSVSGDYRRFFRHQGRRYAHILDPHTGRPVEGVATAVAFGETAAATDALSTAFFVMKEEGTCRYLEGHPKEGAILCFEAEDGLRVVRLGATGSD